MWGKLKESEVPRMTAARNKGAGLTAIACLTFAGGMAMYPWFVRQRTGHLNSKGTSTDPLLTKAGSISLYAEKSAWFDLLIYFLRFLQLSHLLQTPKTTY